MPGDQHDYIAGYTAADDPYCQPNGVLVNLLGLTNTADLADIEAELSALEIDELLRHPVPGQFSAAHLRHLHHQIFRHVYPWAGQFRQVDIAKGETHFVAHQDIDARLEGLFHSAAADHFYQHRDLPAFARAAAAFLIELNLIHPFREGNGRTQRVLLSQMARQAGHQIGWSGISETNMRQACIAGLQGDPQPMTRLLMVYLSAMQG